MFSCQLDHICWDGHNFTVNLRRREVALSDKLLGGCYLGLRFYIYLKPSSASFPLGMKWQTGLGRSTYERPIYYNGLILFPADAFFGSYWYGLEASSGQVVWQQRIQRDSFYQ